MKGIVVLGSTGSIGVQTLDVARRHADRLQVVGLAAGSRAADLLAQAREFGVRHMALGDERLAGEAVADELRAQAARPLVLGEDRRAVEGGEAVPAAAAPPAQPPAAAAPSVPAAESRFAEERRRAEELRLGDERRRAEELRPSEERRRAAKSRLGGGEGSLGFGADAVAGLVRLPEADIVVNALVGAAGLRASVETLRAGKVLALANKESLVVGGDLIMPLAAQADAVRRAAGLAPVAGPAGALMPVDSEHGAIYQCLLGEEPREVSRLWVTASGGPFRGRSREELAVVTPAQALAHPTWNMGAKISIDSSTLMNKGLEVIEAHHLFAMDFERIAVVVQPQSVIHSMVEFADGSVKAHLGTTDMRIPIQFALSYPERWDAPVEALDFRRLGALEFGEPDEEVFRCLALAREAGRRGGTLPCVLNAANEVAVAAFLAGEGSYLGIAACVEEVMEAHEREGVQRVESLEQLEELDAWARSQAREKLARAPW